MRQMNREGQVNPSLARRAHYPLSLVLLGVFVLSLFACGPLAAQAGKPRTVQDEAGLFSKEAKEKADALIARIKSQFKKDLYIETVKTIPIPEGVKKDDAVDAWAAKRHDPASEGIYIAMIVDLQKYRFHVGSGAAKLFTTNNRKEMEKILVGHLKAKEMDQIPTSITEFVFETMRRNSLLASGLQIIEVKSEPARPPSAATR